MSALETAAIEYAERGWPVFPIVPGEKRPLTKHGLLDATTDADVILEWWRANPEANIGIRTGVVFDVLDVDAAHGGWSTFAQLVDEHGPLDLGPVSCTPGGGVHDLFKPTGSGNKTGFVPGCDWRGRNGYIVAPPSIHPNGGVYEWGIAPDEFDLAAAPNWLIELFEPCIPPTPRAPVAIGRASKSKYGRAALESELERLASASVGTRNDQLNRSAYALGQLVAAGVLDSGEVIDPLVEIARRIGLDQHEITKTIDSGLSAGLRVPRSVA